MTAILNGIAAGQGGGLSYEHHVIHEGLDYVHSGELTLANGASYDHLLVVPAGITAHLHLYKLDVTGSPVKHVLYEAPTVTDNGAVQTPYNRNRASSRTARLDVYHAPTVTDVGTTLDYTLIPGGKQEGGIGVSVPFMEWILAADTSYLSRITNSSGNSVTIGYTIDWYEMEAH